MADERSRDDVARLRDLGPLAGSGLRWLAGAADPVSDSGSGDGTGAGSVILGAEYVNTTTGDHFHMRAPGTTAHPQWFKLQYEEA